MLLAFDIGNTNLHLGLWDGTEWRITWRARTVPNKMGDEYAVLIRNYLHEIDLDFKDVTAVVMASVVPVLTATFQQLIKRYFKTNPLIVNHTTNIGIPINIDFPEQVGADRIVNAAAVVALYGGGPAIVVDFGTATNFDVVSPQNEYIGGSLAPGVMLAHDALVSRAARLHKIDLLPPPSAIGRNTTHALQSGIFLGYVALVEGLIARLKAAIPEAKPEAIKVIATGGLATLFNQHTSVIDFIADSLTLDGLRVIWDLNYRGK